MLLDPNATELPKRKDLPKAENAPDGAVWFWGKDDQLGRLNLLTPARIAEAAKLIRTGESISLNWNASLPYPALFGRQNVEHKIHQRSAHSFDDIYHLNTQSGSQWDGFRHCGYHHGDGVVFYNGVTSSEFTTSTRCGMQAWAERGIAGRAVLIDYWGFVGKSYDPNTTHRITVADIQACAKQQGVSFQYGDILLIRSGWVDSYNNMSQEERDKLATIASKDYTLAGVEQSEEMLDFLYDNYFAAIAGDAPTFESWPSKEPWRLHWSLLPLWGMPIGELWDLDKLADVCKSKSQYAFFLSSAPSNMPGGIATCPNALAFF